uniref:CUB domain-containing protein n=1 Tax=Macrostomum lignano TaxID=282301 RepID=A0A1I8JHG7_9PLAT
CSGGLQRLSAEAGGEIASHSGVGTTNYSSNSQCYWQLDAPPGKRVISPNDRVTLYDGLTTSSEIAVVSATDSVGYESPKFVSSANILTVNFYSNSQYVRKGFCLEYKATVSANSSACGPVTFDDASNSSGMIVSHPGYDQHSLYSASMSCSWTLPSVSGKFYQLYVGNVSLGNGDCLSVYQGTASVTDCPDNRNLTNSTGEVVSHSGVREYYYWNNAQCVWYITAPPGQQVWFWFSYFNLGYNDYVSARNMGESSSTIATLSRGYSPSPSGFQSTTRAVSVTFTTNSRDSGLGFRLHYNFTQLYCYGFENVTATKTGSQIRSHYGVGSRYYLNNMSCYWHVSVPVGQRIAFRFTYFNTRTNDRVTVFDGSNGSAVLLSTSGSFNGAIISSANTATVWFNTDSVNRGYGFAVWLQEIDNTANNTCGTISYANSSNVSGVIESHKGYNATSMSAYAPNLACLWTLPKRPGFYIYLFIETYGIGMGDCLKMVTKFFSTASEPGSDGNLQYCNTRFGQNIHWVTSGDAHISFTTDNLHESIGFSIQFYYEQACPSVQKWDSDNGEVVSHTNAGTTHYLNSMTCNWQISVSPGKQVIAWFTSSRIENGYDRVTLYDGLSGSNTLVSSTSIPTDVAYRSTTSSMRVRFTTDGSVRYHGFRMRYSIVENFCDGRKILQASQGKFSAHVNSSSPNYLRHMRCYWTITAPLGYSVVAHITSFSLYYYDYVSISEGIKGSQLIARYYGHSNFQSVISRIFVSKSNAMLVYFVSGRTGPGFEMKYNTTEKFCQGTELLTNDTGELASHSSAGIMGFLINSDCYWFKDDMLCKFTSVCEKYKLITGGSGEISSHQDAGALPYISGVSCKWQFVGKPGIQISANLIYLNLTSNYDSIAFYKGSDDITLVTIRGGASTWPKKFVTLSNILTVVFITGNVAGNNTNGLGFRLQYSVGDSVEPATTSSKQTSSSTARAVVSSPSSPATTKIVSDTSFAPESTTTGKLSQT